MKNSAKPRQFDVGGVNQRPSNKAWLAMRNTGRIEQLEASHQTLKKQLAILVEHIPPKLCKTTQLDEWSDMGESLSIVSKPQERVETWGHIIPRREVTRVPPKAPSLPYQDHLDKIENLFANLEHDFADIPRRIVQAAILENELASFEEGLEDDESEHLAWCVSLVRDALDYNYAEDLDHHHLELIQEAVTVVCAKGPSCSRTDYQDLHEAFLEAGFELVPVTQKAIEKYGE